MKNTDNHAQWMDGDYVAILREVFDSGTHHGKRTWVFLFEAGLKNDAHVRFAIGRMVNLKDDPMLRKLIHALSDTPIPKGDVHIDAGLLLGRCCRITIETWLNEECEPKPTITNAMPLRATDKQLRPKIVMSEVPQWIQELIDQGFENEAAMNDEDDVKQTNTIMGDVT